MRTLFTRLVNIKFSLIITTAGITPMSLTFYIYGILAGTPMPILTKQGDGLHISPKSTPHIFAVGHGL